MEEEVSVKRSRYMEQGMDEEGMKTTRQKVAPAALQNLGGIVESDDFSEKGDDKEVKRPSCSRIGNKDDPSSFADIDKTSARLEEKETWETKEVGGRKEKATETAEVTQLNGTYELSMGTDVSPHKIPEAQHGHQRECLQEQNNQKYTERTPAAESTLYASKGKCNREMLRLGLHPAPQTKAGESSVANGLTACGQEACQMGCVCSSLSCPNMEKEHCGQVQCMLCCTCNSIASVASSTPPAPSQTGTDASGHDQSPACASLGPKSLGSVAGSRMKRTRKVPLRYTKQDVWYGGPLLFGTSDVITPRVQARSRMRLPSHLPMDDEDVLDRQYFQLSCRVRVRVPLYRLPQVSPFCIVHQSHNCRKYAERGSCYKLTAHRLRQLGRNVAVRSRRLPPTIFRPRHDHSARTFAVRKTKRPMEFLPLKHSCLLAGAVYKGAQAPRLPVPPRRPPTIVQLPDPVACQDVERVVRIVSSETSATAPNNTQHVAVRLRNGMLNVLSSTPVPPGMTWRIESADDVLVADKDGHRFRNPPEGQRLNAVSVEDSEGQLYRMPLVTINYQLQFLRARAISRDGVITIYAKDAPQSDKRRKLYRVNMRTHKLHESGMVLLRRVTAGTFIVIGIVKACDEEKEWIAEAVRFLCGLGGGMVQSSLRCMLEAFDIDRVWQLNSASAYRMPTTSVPTSLEEKGKTSQMIRYVSPSRAPKHFLRPVSSTDVPSLSLTCEESVSDADGDQVCTLKDGSGAPAYEQQRSQKRPRCHPIKQRVVPTEVQKRVCLSDGESAAGGAPQKAPHPCELNQQRESVATDIPPQKPLSVRDKKPAAEGAPQILPLMSRPTQQQAGISPDIQTQMSVCSSRKPSSGETPQSALPMGGLSQQCLSSSPDEQTQTPPCSSNTSAAGASLSVPPSSGLKQACYGGSPRIRLRVEDGKVVAVTQGGKNIQVAATKSSKDVTKGHMKVAVKGGISTVNAAAKDGSVSGCGLLGTNCSLDGDASNVTEHAPGSVSSCGKLGLAVTEDAQPNAKSSNCDKIIVSFKRHEQEALRKAINAAHQVPTKAFPLLAPRQPTTLQPGQLSGQPTLKSTDVTVLRQGKPCDVIRVSVSTVSQVPAASKSVSGAGSKSASGAGANPPVPGSLPTVTLSGSALSGQSKPVSTVNIKRGDPTSQNPSQAAKPTFSRQSGETKRQTTTTTVSDDEKAATSSQTPSYTLVSSSRSFLCMGKSSALPKPQTVDSSASCRAQSLTSSQSNSEVGDAAKVTRATKEVMHQKPGPTSKTGPELPQVVQSGKERQGLSTTMASQSAANQNEQNKAKSTGGARLSYVRMPPERVEGRMVTARFGGKPSRWNMIEVDKVPDLMHVDGIPISLTKRYLKHAVHQVKNTGRPVSTKVNNVLVTIVWMPHLPDFVFLGPIKEQPGTRSSTEPVPVAVAGSTAPAPSALGVAAVAGQRTPTETVTSTATSSGPTQRPSTASKTVIIPSKPKAKATSATPPSAATRPHVVKAEALSRRVGNVQRPPAPSAPPAARRAAPAAAATATATVDPLSPSMELSAALAFDEPGASATGDSDDEVVVLPPPPPRAPLDVILLDNSDISDDELVLDTNTECPERMPAASQSVGEASTSGPGRPRSGGMPTASSVQTPAAAAPASGGASHETAPPTVPTPAVAASHVSRPSAKTVPDVDQISAKAVPHVDRPSAKAVPHVDRPSAKAAPQVDRPSAKAVPHVIRPSAKAVPHVIRPSAKASPSSSGPLKRVLPPPSAPLLRAVLAPSTVGSGAGTRDPGRPSTSSAAEEPSPARPEPDGATATDSEPRPKRRKQQLQERPIQSPVPPFVPTPPRVRVRVNAGEYTAAKHALEELLFGRLENATPIKRQTVLVLKTAQEEVRVQRSRHSQLKVRLWQVSQKQRNLLNRLNRGLAELPLEKRIEKIAEIEDLLSFVQVRVDGDEHEPVMLLEQKQSQQPSQFRVIAPDGVPAAPPSAEDTDADELSVM
ncbi:nascent polypeptide-associated complex subunit alpha, muscle-specific form-like isoform X2 [Amphibalanus amphitrite]|uniref:nascent polypeptide-associated complex subunit alpha, muscle-specific form-like isoform X2 n=1 Tax=Amphibalanus amphitrite TaxID=1232801 RepID=UPI001C921D1B|nr:nascent polypeptide-associated complex subunit alpha, muscle-specific form-like isoform X2 [Amphibalanus amphitrite]